MDTFDTLLNIHTQDPGAVTYVSHLEFRGKDPLEADNALTLWSKEDEVVNPKEHVHTEFVINKDTVIILGYSPAHFLQDSDEQEIPRLRGLLESIEGLLQVIHVSLLDWVAWD